MPDLLRFDQFCIALFIPRDTDDSIADAARAVLDDPEFRVGFVNAIQQFFATAPALSVLPVAVEM